VAISNVNVENTVTPIVSENGYRDSVTIQHVDTTDGNVAIWVSTNPAMTVGQGFYVSALGGVFSTDRENGAANAWYGISAGNTVTIVVATGEN
jgi:hypothetical protein